MKAKQFFDTETINSAYEKIPEGDSYIQKDTLDIETTEAIFKGVPKTRYKLNYKDKDGQTKEYEVGVSIVRGIETELPKLGNFIRITRQGTTKEDTHYTVTSVEN